MQAMAVLRGCFDSQYGTVEQPGLRLIAYPGGGRQNGGAGSRHLERKQQGLAARRYDHLVGADLAFELPGVKVCDRLSEFRDPRAGQVALARGVFDQRADDFRMGRKTGLAESQVVNGLAPGPHLPHAFVDIQGGRGR